MPRRKSLILFTVFFTMAALFVSTEIMAGTTDCSASYNLPEGYCTRLDIGYEIRFDPTFTHTNAAGETCFRAIGYKFLKNASINQAHGSVDGDLQVVSANAGSEPLGNVFPPDVGSTYDNVGAGMGTWTISWTPVPSGQTSHEFCIAGAWEMGKMGWTVTSGKGAGLGSTVGPVIPQPVQPPSGSVSSTTLTNEAGDVSVRCFYDSDGNIIVDSAGNLACFDSAGNQVGYADITDVYCVMTEADGTQHTVQPTYWAEGTQMTGTGSTCVWEYYRGKWIYKCASR